MVVLAETPNSPSDKFLQILSDVEKVYCEDDFLLETKTVAMLGFRYSELNRAVAALEEDIGKYCESSGCQYNGYGTLAAVSRSLIQIAEEKGESILSRVANLSQVKLFIKGWSEKFARMTDILNIAAG